MESKVRTLLAPLRKNHCLCLFQDAELCLSQRIVTVLSIEKRPTECCSILGVDAICSITLVDPVPGDTDADVSFRRECSWDF